MKKQLVSNLKEIKEFGHLALLALFSFMPVFLLVVTWLIWSRNRKYIRLFGETHHAYCIGFTIIFMVHKVPYHYLKLFLKEHLYCMDFPTH
jgi:cell division protein FtsW